MSGLWLLFDLLLAGGLVLLAWRCLHAATLFMGVVLFIAFGLLMALAWVRLDATDIALAEAAVGAGVTGALLLDALGHVAGEPRERAAGAAAERRADAEDDRAAVAGRPARALIAVLVVAFTAVLGLGVWHLPDGTLLREQVLAALQDHPVANAATAVLLDFRAWDTFLEMGVLALAGMGAFLLKARELREPRALPPAQGSVVLDTLARVLVPLMVLVAGYLFWAGTAHSGGAFPAGALLGAAGVLLLLAGIGQDAVADGSFTRLVLALGLFAFLLAGAPTMLAGRAFLAWGEGWAYPAIVALEAVLTLAIGGTLALLFGASAKQPPESVSPGRAEDGMPGAPEQAR